MACAAIGHGPKFYFIFTLPFTRSLSLWTDKWNLIQVHEINIIIIILQMKTEQTESTVENDDVHYSLCNLFDEFEINFDPFALGGQWVIWLKKNLKFYRHIQMHHSVIVP